MGEPETWWVLESEPSPAAYNMALDEALMESAAKLGAPVLRFYGWSEPAASFGYFQKYEEVERVTLLRPLVRRPTGGGIVPHDADWTYSLVVPAGHEWYSLNASDSYQRVHEWIVQAFAKLGVATEVAETCKVAGPGQCFVGYEKFDVLWRGRKVAGAAQRRTRSGLLVQGSVQPPPGGLEGGSWQQAMRDSVPSAGTKWRELRLDGSLKARIEELISQKYAQSSYIQRR